MIKVKSLQSDQQADRPTADKLARNERADNLFCTLMAVLDLHRLPFRRCVEENVIIERSTAESFSSSIRLSSNNGIQPTYY